MPGTLYSVSTTYTDSCCICQYTRVKKSVVHSQIYPQTSCGREREQAGSQCRETSNDANVHVQMLLYGSIGDVLCSHRMTQRREGYQGELRSARWR